MRDLGMPLYFVSSVMKYSIKWTAFALMFGMMISKAFVYFFLRKSVRTEEVELLCVVVVVFMMLSSSRSFFFLAFRSVAVARLIGLFVVWRGRTAVLIGEASTLVRYLRRKVARAFFV